MSSAVRAALNWNFRGSDKGWTSDQVDAMTIAVPIRAQLAAIAELRWRMFLNGLRKRRARLELFARIVVTTVFAVGGLGGFVGAAVGGWYFVSRGQPEFLAIPLWTIFLFWQFFPIMATAFTNNPDSSELLRFPLAYRAFFLVRLVYGMFDPASALGSVFTLGVLLGIFVASPMLAVWAVPVLFTFGLFNLLLMQMIFAWVERWLAQRRTREIFGVLFILTMLSLQLVGPAMERLNRHSHPQLRYAFVMATRVQKALPPGIAASAIANATARNLSGALLYWLLLAAVALVIGSLLHLRLRAQFRGENLSEAAAGPTEKSQPGMQLGWTLPGFSSSVAAVFEKETRYILRSGPMLLTLIMPVFMLIVVRMGPMNPMRSQSAFSRMPDLAFPGAAGYALLVLTNLVYNSFGGDGAGVQFFFASPVGFRFVALGKNLTHAAILLFNTAFALIAVSVLYGAPTLPVIVATFVGLLYAAPVTFAAGNLLSLYFPKKRDFSRFGRQNMSQTVVLASLGVQLVVMGLGAAIFFVAHMLKNLWIPSLIFLLLAAISIPGYVLTLNRVDGIAIQRREAMLEELCRA